MDNFMDDDFDSADPARTVLSQSLADILNIPEEKTRYILPQLIPEGEAVHIRIGKDVNALFLASFLSFGCSAGHRIQPYGWSKPTKTAFIVGKSYGQRAREHLRLLHEKEQRGEHRAWAHGNLLVVNALEHHELRHANWTTIQRSIEESLPEDCKLVVYFETPQVFAKHEADLMDRKISSNHLRRLNQKGIATVVFYSVGKRGCDLLDAEISPNGNNYVIDLTYDPAAPCEFGGGFNVLQKRRSEFDTSPRCYQFWYTVIERKLDFGWEIRDSEKAPCAKQIQVIERQMSVERMDALGMQQKDIAAKLQVHAATVSRDLAAIRSRSIAGKAEEGDASNEKEG